MELSLKPRGKATCSQTRASLPQTREETFISATLTAPLSLHIWSGPISDTPVTGGEMELRCTTLGMHVGDLDLYNYVSTHSEKVSRSFLTQQALCNLPSTRRKHEHCGTTCTCWFGFRAHALQHIIFQDTGNIVLVLYITCSEKDTFSIRYYAMLTCISLNVGNSVFPTIWMRDILIRFKTLKRCVDWYDQGNDVHKPPTAVGEADRMGGLVICSQC